MPMYLGKNAPLSNSPASFTLDSVTNDYPLYSYFVRLTAPEFTSLCPVTGQPDFGTIILDYQPNRDLIESKAWKLFLASFRNHAAYHESCANLIAERVWLHIKPKWLRVSAIFQPRGGIPIHVYVDRGMADFAENMPAHPSTTHIYRGQ